LLQTFTDNRKALCGPFHNMCPHSTVHYKNEALMLHAS